MTDEERREAEEYFNDEHACLTGDCPHATMRECFIAGYAAACEAKRAELDQVRSASAESNQALAEDVEGLAREVTDLRLRARWNIEESGDLVEVCTGEHEKSAACDYRRFVPIAKLEAERARAEKLIATLKGYASPFTYISDRIKSIADLQSYAIAALAEYEASRD